ncbi:uncharacterized protein [Ptychodera flava]|uniref:uncharacterized protein n=1 Tax=Ptychodera flava TaxID=63121 RepID=UPI003969DE6C
MLVDSGATANIVDEDTWKTLKAKKIQCASYKQNTELYPYASDKPLTVIGGFSCDIKVGKQKTVAKFSVVKGSGVPLLGKTTATLLGALKVGVDVVNSISDQKAGSDEEGGGSVLSIMRNAKVFTKQVVKR